jgi:hypothetical protein
MHVAAVVLLGAFRIRHRRDFTMQGVVGGRQLWPMRFPLLRQQAGGDFSHALIGAVRTEGVPGKLLGMGCDRRSTVSLWAWSVFQHALNHWE